MQGFSADGTKTVFRANDELIEGVSAPCCELQVYLASAGGGPPQLVSVLPGGEACAAEASVGTENKPGGPGETGRYQSVSGAVSSEASLVYFSCGEELYLRNTEAGATVAVSAGVPTSGRVLGGLAGDLLRRRPGPRALRRHAL